MNNNFHVNCETLKGERWRLNTLVSAGFVPWLRATVSLNGTSRPCWGLVVSSFLWKPFGENKKWETFLPLVTDLAAFAYLKYFNQSPHVTTPAAMIQLGPFPQFINNRVSFDFVQKMIFYISPSSRWVYLSPRSSSISHSRATLSLTPLRKRLPLPRNKILSRQNGHAIGSGQNEPFPWKSIILFQVISQWWNSSRWFYCLKGLLNPEPCHTLLCFRSHC